MKTEIENAHRVYSFEEYIARVGEMADDAGDGSILLLYRGQEKGWPLLPKIGRDPKFLEDFQKREKELMQEFRRLAHPYLVSGSTLNSWDGLAVAQHHRLPTRLLDWTANPLVALWFAFAKPRVDHPNEIDRVVCALHVSKTEVVDGVEGDPYDMPKTVVFRPKHTTKTITAQNGWFTVHKYLSAEKAFIQLNRHKLYRKKLVTFLCANSLRDSVLDRLNQFGINHQTLFPDLYGLCDFLEWKHFCHSQPHGVLPPGPTGG